MAGKASQYYPNGVRPHLGDTVSGATIGRSNGIFTWSACPDCGLERWVSRQQVRKLCMKCAAIRRNLTGERNPRWNGGIRRAGGYNYVSVPENHPFIAMAGRVFAHGKYRYCIAEHRLVMAQHLGRPLEKWELVHHKNGIKDDNRIGNLELLKSHKEHLPSMGVQNLIASQRKRIVLLEAENIVLKSLLAEYQGNPELADPSSAGRASVETIHGASSNEGDEERVRAYRKLYE